MVVKKLEIEQISRWGCLGGRTGRLIVGGQGEGDFFALAKRRGGLPGVDVEADLDEEAILIVDVLEKSELRRTKICNRGGRSTWENVVQKTLEVFGVLYDDFTIGAIEHIIFSVRCEIALCQILRIHDIIIHYQRWGSLTLAAALNELSEPIPQKCFIIVLE